LCSFEAMKSAVQTHSAAQNLEKTVANAKKELEEAEKVAQGAQAAEAQANCPATPQPGQSGPAPRTPPGEPMPGPSAPLPPPGLPPAPTAGAKLPSDAAKALTEIEQGAARPNVRNPKPFVNDGRGGTARLPSQDATGKPIAYTEHTVNSRPPGGTLDGKRIVTGSDGSVWYTDDHFTTWTRVK